MPGKVLKKLIQELQKRSDEDSLNAQEQGISDLLEMPELFSLNKLTNLTLAHNKLTSIPAQIADLVNLTQLNLSNNQIEELPTSISSLSKLKILKLCFNRLSVLPRGFGAFYVLEILDLSYNNLNEKSLPNNFLELKTNLRALYLSDNIFEMLPADIFKLENLSILSVRDNDLLELPSAISHLKMLKELHLQSNRLQLLPVSIVSLDSLFNAKNILKLDNNPWVPSIADAIKISINHLQDYLSSEAYESFYNQVTKSGTLPIPPKSDKAKKFSKK